MALVRGAVDAGPGAVPAGAPDDALRTLVEASPDGLGELDAAGRFTFVNAAGAAVLRRPAAELVGRPAPFVTGPLDPGDAGGRLAAWTSADGRRRTLEYRTVPRPGGGAAVWFSDVTDVVRQQERLTAIVRAASSVAGSGSLRATLDAVAREVVMTGNIGAVQILALDDPHEELQILGMAGFGAATDFTERLSECRRLGARVLFMEAFESGRPVVQPHRKAAILADPTWAPLHEVMDVPDWDSFVAVPLIVRGRTVGVINAYYLPDEDPGPGSLVFLEAMADHAAVAIDTAALLAQARSQAESDERRRLARDLHDSVVQQLFSMRLQAGALQAQLDDGADPGRVRAAATELAELSQSALADLRGLVFELRPLDLAERGLVESVRVHADGLEVRSGLCVEVIAPEDLELEWGLDVQEDVYRIVQEALHNTVKHARAADAWVRFSGEPGGTVVVEVVDDGCGGDEPGDGMGPTLGIVSMRERAERWGGRLHAGPGPDGGWAVRLVLPATPTGLNGGGR
ncbi:histidine kinase [Modestobacter sp. NPDC049651]|uniref:sensor histidine kinase n=1 Tax=unclassified Modestobacter TaxID=2643866 RepID=UPI0033D26122